MKLLLLLLTLIVSEFSGAYVVDESKKKYTIDSIERVESIPLDQAEIVFTILNDGIFTNATITYAVDKNPVNDESGLDVNKTFTSMVVPGDHRYSFYVNSRFKEMKTGKIEARGGHRTTVILNFKENRIKKSIYRKGKARRQARKYKRKGRRRPDVRMKKPVIYLYPEEKIEVSIKLEVNGTLTFSYPEYDAGWNVTADENGTITHNDSDYNYLFWEGDRQADKDLVDESEGFIIEGSKITSFLEEKLLIFGFTSKERADFITFWAPMMVSHENIFVHFKVNQDCDAFAELTIVPTPDEIARFYILWSPIDEKFDRTQVKAQKLPTMNREGFTVLEWGGSEINLQNNQSM
ncbi:MAG: hypothetical protein ACI837_001087 [Crocinitomicaceae bacterium]|jgi:hypothetical protein